MTRHLFYWLIIMCMSQVQAKVNVTNYHDFWLWAGVKPQPVLAQANSVYILQGQISLKDHRPVFVPQGIAIPKLKTPSVWISYRVETLNWTPDILSKILTQLHRWELAGNNITGLQIDFDASTLQLNRYGAFLTKLRKDIPAKYQISITGLMDWSMHTSAHELNQLSQVINEIVIQTYQGTKTIPTYLNYINKLTGLTVPFKIGLVQHGEWQEPEVLRQQPMFKGYVVFLVNEKHSSLPLPLQKHQ